jgi:hypothetical protein
VSAVITPGAGNLNLYRGKFRFIGHGPNSDVSSSTAISPNIWYHVAATYDGSVGRLYINGAEDANGRQSFDTRMTPFFVRARSDLSAFVDGAIDEVLVYNRALSPSEIMGLYKAK